MIKKSNKRLFIPTNKSQGGFIKLLVLFVIFIAIVTYFNISVSDIVEWGPVQTIINFFKIMWINFFSPAINWLYDGMIKFFSSGEVNIESSVESLNKIITGTTTSSTATTPI